MTDHGNAGAQGPTSLVHRYWFGIDLWKRILAALLLGAVAGLLWGEGATQIKWIGDLFVRLIQMIVAPLVFVTIVAGVVGMQDPRRLGTIGIRTLFLYLVSALFAIGIGLALGALVQPGLGADFAGAVPREVEAARPFAGMIESIVPSNPIAALAEGQILAVIFFAILLGAAVLVTGETAKPVADLFKAGSEAMVTLVGFIMEVAPFGVFALIAWVMGTSGPDTFVHVAKLAFCVVIGCALQIFVVQAGLVKLLGRLPVIPYLRGVTDPALVAFSTSSSSASLAASMTAAEKNLGIGKPVVSTVLPLGVTVSMDGTALYIALLATFAAQAFGVTLSFQDYLLIAVTTVLVAVGTAPVPSASLFMLAAVLQSIGIGPVQTGLLVGFILPFDRVLDMTRTVANVLCDLAVATVVGRWENDIDIETYKAPPVI